MREGFIMNTLSVHTRWHVYSNVHNVFFFFLYPNFLLYLICSLNFISLFSFLYKSCQFGFIFYSLICFACLCIHAIIILFLHYITFKVSIKIIIIELYLFILWYLSFLIYIPVIKLFFFTFQFLKIKKRRDKATKKKEDREKTFD